jgi:hypothetical protein
MAKGWQALGQVQTIGTFEGEECPFCHLIGCLSGLYWVFFEFCPTCHQWKRQLIPRPAKAPEDLGSGDSVNKYRCKHGAAAYVHTRVCPGCLLNEALVLAKWGLRWYGIKARISKIWHGPGGPFLLIAFLWALAAVLWYFQVRRPAS